jgi:hypothetical protein
MSDPQHKDKVEQEKQPDIKKTPEYRKFKKLLKQVITSPPLKRRASPPLDERRAP